MQSLLDIKNLKALKDLSFDELITVCALLREQIIDVMSKNGGHLASNLGSVELSLAVHRVFNSPQDKILFDTSHQAYTHKILTGRLARFSTIRTYKGLSGFTSPDESEHDHFFAGHAGTALSLSLGVAKARDLSNEDFHVISMIGDAAFTCGLTLEALGNIPKDLRNFIILLNDNGMSISKNVGAVTDLFKHRELKNYFEHFNLDYIGPIDGHDVKALTETLEKNKNSPRPILIHAMTNKGHGMDKAAADPVCYHGAKPFDKISGDFLSSSSSQTTFPKIFGEVMVELSKKHSEIVTLTPAMPVGSCLVDLMELFPARCLDVGIAEGHCMTFAGGIALDRSKKVFVSIYATFLQRALDNLFQDICLQKAPIVLALDRAGLAGGDGATHHGIYDIGFLKAMPHLVIAQPRNGDLLKDLLYSSLTYNTAFAIRYPNLATKLSSKSPIQRKIGEGEVLKEGQEIALFALGHLVDIAFKVGEILSLQGVDITIVDPIFIKPLDEELLKQVLKKHTMVVTLEEHSLQGGFGESINTFILQHYPSTHVLNLGLEDKVIEQGTHKELLKESGLDAESIAKKIESCFFCKETIFAGKTHDHRDFCSSST